LEKQRERRFRAGEKVELEEGAVAQSAFKCAFCPSAVAARRAIAWPAFLRRKSLDVWIDDINYKVTFRF
jgi:hypothetical protein